MTFKDFITECENYPHSKEHFDLMKESSELCLTEQFLMDQEFMVTNSAIFEGVELPEGYLHESVDESTIDVMMEKFDVKKAVFNSKIYQGLVRILKALKNFFMKIGNKFDDTTSKGQAIKKRLANAKLEDVDVEAIKKIVEGVKSAETSNFPVKVNQPYLKEIKLGTYTSSDPSVSSLKNDIAAALSNTYVLAEVSIKSNGNANENTIGALPAEDIKDALARLQMSNSKSTVVGVCGSLTSSWTTAHTKGLKINVNTKEIDKLADDLDKICTQITQMSQEKAIVGSFVTSVAGNISGAIEAKKKEADSTVVGPPEVDEASKNVDADAMKILNSGYSMLTTAIGQTMQIYTKLNSYRTGVINGLETFLK